MGVVQGGEGMRLVNLARPSSGHQPCGKVTISIRMQLACVPVGLPGKQTVVPSCEAVGPLLADPVRARAQGVAGQAHAHHVHDWEALARATMRIYEGASSRA